MLSVIDYGFGILTLSASQLRRLDVVQNEAMRTILGCTRDTSAEAMRHILDLPCMDERHKIAQANSVGPYVQKKSPVRFDLSTVILLLIWVDYGPI